MDGRITTRKTIAGFRREDITFHNARRQDEILKELPKEYVENAEPDVPASTTPEQVIKYYEDCIAVTEDKQKKHIYALTIKWIKELEEIKRDNIAKKIKEITNAKVKEASLENVEVE